MDLRTLRTLQGHSENTFTPVVTNDEETFIIDERGKLSPSEQVDRKLVALVGEGAVPVSQLNAARWCQR
jgi:hypothetical protein